MSATDFDSLYQLIFNAGLLFVLALALLVVVKDECTILLLCCLLYWMGYIPFYSGV
jgi:hypothetical protein